MKIIKRRGAHQIVLAFILLAIFCIIGMFSSSCSKRNYTQKTVNVYDSVYVHDTTIIRDTIIKTDSARVTIRADSIKLAKLQVGDTIKKKNKNATATIYKEGSKTGLVVECDCDSLAIAIALQDKITEKVRTVSKTETVVQTKRYMTWYVKILTIGGAAMFVYFIILVILTILRK